jgi:hypothetical protein
MRLWVKEPSILNRAARSAIGERLRSVYEPVTKQQIPARHLELLEQVELEPTRPARDQDSAADRES